MPIDFKQQQMTSELVYSLTQASSFCLHNVVRVKEALGCLPWYVLRFES